MFRSRKYIQSERKNIYINKHTKVYKESEKKMQRKR